MCDLAFAWLEALCAEHVPRHGELRVVRERDLESFQVMRGPMGKGYLAENATAWIGPRYYATIAKARRAIERAP